MISPFLTAHWKSLALLNYSVPEQLLTPYLPKSCELDKYNGQHFLSIVAFEFLNTKVLGIPWPGFMNFIEVNLRFYIRYKEERGVCFIREFVPSQWITYIAKKVYNEPYKKAKIFSDNKVTDEEIHVNYKLYDNQSSIKIKLQAQNAPYLPPQDSKEHFFKEHNLGVGKDKKGNTLTYKVDHPHWKVFPIKSVSFQIDWESLFGPPFLFLNDKQPDSIFFAEGSDVQVYKKKIDPHS